MKSREVLVPSLEFITHSLRVGRRQQCFWAMGNRQKIRTELRGEENQDRSEIIFLLPSWSHSVWTLGIKPSLWVSTQPATLPWARMHSCWISAFQQWGKLFQWYPVRIPYLPVLQGTWQNTWRSWQSSSNLLLRQLSGPSVLPLPKPKLVHWRLKCVLQKNFPYLQRNTNTWQKLYWCRKYT